MCGVAGQQGGWVACMPATMCGVAGQQGGWVGLHACNNVWGCRAARGLSWPACLAGAMLAGRMVGGCGVAPPPPLFALSSHFLGL
eukprot:61532-Chlamydomonas_euryale.AAC.2